MGSVVTSAHLDHTVRAAARDFKSPQKVRISLLSPLSAINREGEERNGRGEHILLSTEGKVEVAEIWGGFLLDLGT